jgi:hypothetical protein
MGPGDIPAVRPRTEPMAIYSVTCDNIDMKIDDTVKLEISLVYPEHGIEKFQDEGRRARKFDV